MNLPLLLAATPLVLANSVQDPYPFRLQFEPGEVLRYRETVTSSGTMTFGGQSESVTMTGSRIQVMNVGHVGPDGYATMKVSFEDVKASAKITKAPSNVSAADRNKAEQGLTEQLKAELQSGSRTQTVSPRGVTTYRFEAGPNRFIEIVNGTFLMLVLPESPPVMNQNWFVDVTQADPNSGAPIKVNYKLVGASMIGDLKAYKVALYAQKTEQQSDGDTKGTSVIIIRGFVNLTLETGKVLGGEITTDITQTLTRGNMSQRQNRVTVQKFDKI